MRGIARFPPRTLPAAALALPAAALLAVTATPAQGDAPTSVLGSLQGANIRSPLPEIERKLRKEPFEVQAFRGTRFEDDRTQRAILQFADSSRMIVKWAKAPRGGGEYNNRPRYEVAAYRFQQLFLEEDEYVVPPTVVRSFPLEWYRELEPQARATFPGTESVVVVLQYWLWNVTGEKPFDRERFARDTAYARHFANLNIYTYLCRHNDANRGNVLVSADASSPRVYSVDNGLTFGLETSERGHFWRELQVDRLPASTVERLREIELPDLYRRLGVIAEFHEKGERLVRAEPGVNLDPTRGIRRKDGVVQLGLTRAELERVYARLQRLLKRVDQGEIGTF